MGDWKSPPICIKISTNKNVLSMKQAHKFMCVHAFVKIYKCEWDKRDKIHENSCIFTKNQEMEKGG